MELDKGNEEIARSMIKEIMYDNNMVDRNNPEKYPKKHVEAIALAAGFFFEKNPTILTNAHIYEICTGEHGEVQDRYGSLEGYKELSDALDNYFNNG